MNIPLVVTGHLIAKPGKEQTLMLEELLAQPIRVFKHFLVITKAGD